MTSESGNVFAVTAGNALDVLTAGPHQDKRIARLFGVTPRMARYLRAGKHWTIERLALASALLGHDFNLHLIARFVPEPLRSDKALDVRLSEVERQLAELRNALQRGSE